MKQNGLLLADVPLVVDLDGTLIRTDLLLESALRLIKHKPWLVLRMPLWLLRGRAYLKREIFHRVKVDVQLLPFNDELLTWLRSEKAKGRRLVLATASDYQQAYAVAEPLALFDTVLGSDGQHNLKGPAKLKTIIDVCGQKFDYIGNSRADLAIWRGCRHAILANASRRVERSARRAGNVVRVFPSASTGLRDFPQAMRVRDWRKNLVLFVPAIISRAIFDGSVFANAMVAFLSFGFATSAGGILDDLLDLEEDRRHMKKKQRPFASGRLFIGCGIAIAVALLFASAAMASWLPRGLAAALTAFFILTSLYSLFLKRFLSLSLPAVALLYTLRIIAGGLATGVTIPSWLLVITFFVFLGLASAKRASDLGRRQRNTANP
ncbi:MAG TPA: UbiA family prenyltransferase [Candidatus Binatia bacterium]|jgi:phosphoserine phosphatase